MLTLYGLTSLLVADLVEPLSLFLLLTAALCFLGGAGIPGFFLFTAAFCLPCSLFLPLQTALLRFLRLSGKAFRTALLCKSGSRGIVPLLCTSGFLSVLTVHSYVPYCMIICAPQARRFSAKAS